MRSSFDLYTAFHAIFDTPLKRGALASALIACAIALPFLLVPYEDFRYCDETYQAYCCAHYGRAYLGMLSFYVGNIWMRLFGETLISLRVLMTICYIASAAIGCAYVRRRGFSTLKTSLVFFLGTFGLVISYLPLYGWDAGAYPYTALGMVSALLYLEQPRRRYAAAIGASAALMALSRIPLAVYFPVGLAAICLASRGPERLKDAAAAVVAFLLVALALTTAMAGSPAAYLVAFKPENTVAAHSVDDIGWIFDRCVKHAYATYTMLMPGCVALLLSCCFAKTRKVTWFLILLAIPLLYYTLRGAVWNQDSIQGFFWSNSGIIIPTAFAVMAFGPVRGISNPPGDNGRMSAWPASPITASAILAGFALLQALGSNSPVERIGWGLSMVFGFGVFARQFLKAPVFTFYLLAFSSLTTFGFFVLKARTLSQVYGEPVELYHATAYNGTRPFGNDYYVVESVDSIKFVADNAKAAGLRQVVVGRDLNCYNFGVGETGVNAGIRFDVYTEDLYRDYADQNGDDAADIVVCLNITRDTVFEGFLLGKGYVPYQRTSYPCLAVWAKDSVASRLPADPFTAWGYRPRVPFPRNE